MAVLPSEAIHINTKTHSELVMDFEGVATSIGPPTGGAPSPHPFLRLGTSHKMWSVVAQRLASLNISSDSELPSE